MKIAELLTETLMTKLAASVAHGLQSRLDEKGANLAVAETVTSPQGNVHVRVKMNPRGGSLTRTAVRRTIDDYLGERFPDDNLLGITYVLSLAGVKNSYHIYLARNT